MTGGGFGGSVVLLAEHARVPTILERLPGRIVHASDGAHELNAH
jgi:galactokinase